MGCYISLKVGVQMWLTFILVNAGGKNKSIDC